VQLFQRKSQCHTLSRLIQESNKIQISDVTWPPRFFRVTTFFKFQVFNTTRHADKPYNKAPKSVLSM